MTLNSKCENAASGAAPDANIDGAAAEINMRSETEAFLNRIHAYVDHDLLPRRLAEERRKSGDSRASPRDYDCHCPLAEDLLPTCHERAPQCRFRHRKPPPGPRYCNDPVRFYRARAMFREELDRFFHLRDKVCEQQAFDYMLMINRWHADFVRRCDRQREKQCQG